MSRKPTNAEQLIHITGLVRRLFHTMGSQLNNLHQDLGVSARMQSVMSALRDEHKSVPDLAQERQVSRQHIQVIANELLEADLVRKKRNPAHRRSDLLELTARGRRVMAKIDKREAALLPEMVRQLRGVDLHATAAGLEALDSFFASEQWQTTAARHSPQFRE